MSTVKSKKSKSRESTPEEEQPKVKVTVKKKPSTEDPLPKTKSTAKKAASTDDQDRQPAQTTRTRTTATTQTNNTSATATTKIETTSKAAVQKSTTTNTTTTTASTLPTASSAASTSSSRATTSASTSAAARRGTAPTLQTLPNRRAPTLQPRGPNVPTTPSSVDTPSSYTHQQLHVLEKQSRKATAGHIVYGADYIIQLLSSHEIDYALMGGFSLRLRGSPRLTLDVDLAVATTMQKLRAALVTDPRVRIPQGPVSGVMRVFVRVGGQFHAGLAEVPVCVDLISEASLGAPKNVLDASEEVDGQTERGPRKYRLLDVKHLLKAKMAAFTSRGGGESNDFGDIMWLLNSEFATRVWEVSGAVPMDQRKAFMEFMTVQGAQRGLTAAQIQYVKKILKVE